MDNENTGIRLLKKGKKKLINIVFSRIGLVSLLLLIQVLFIIGMLYKFEEYLPHAVSITTIFGIIMVIYILNSNYEPTAKVTWLIILMVVPVFGGLLLLFTKSDWGHRALKERVNIVMKSTSSALSQSDEVLEKIKTENPETASLARYIHQSGCYPIYDNADVKYFPSGEAKFEELLIQLEKAEKFIFLEYFIIDEGVMWGKILDILAKKAAQGVEVRVMYDGTCEFALLPHDYPKRLKKLGIQCKIFAPITPFVSTHYNYRDHRKILVIDGVIAFTGGINLADEYINVKVRHGHWKDTAIMIKGEAAKSFTLMFLQMWAIDEKTTEYDKYLNVMPKIEKSDGFIIPYSDCPLDNYRTGECVYMNILNRANNYVHIMSPYLILDGELETALRFAAERGVDVKLILPGVPDKSVPYSVAKTHYASLIASGVKIYEYTPGFVHSKLFVSDDIKAVVGTINLDYRSLYHHFECAAYMYNTSCIADIENDFNETLKKCSVVTKETIKNESKRLKLLGLIIKGFSPLL